MADDPFASVASDPFAAPAPAAPASADPFASAAGGGSTAPPRRPGASPLAVIGEHMPTAKGGALDKVVRKAKVEQHRAAIDPIGWVDAVLGGPQRAVAGLITSHGDVGHAWQVMTHPHDAALQEHEIKALMKTFRIPEPEGNSMLAMIGRFGARFFTQNITDPINLVPILGQFRAAEKGLTAARAVIEAAGSVGAKLPVVDRVARAGETLGGSSIKRVARDVGRAGEELFGRRPELSKVHTKDGKDIIDKATGAVTARAGAPLLSKKAVSERIGIETKHRSYEAAQGAHDHALLNESEVQRALRNMKPGDELPDAVRHRYLFEPWAHGTPHMRTQAEVMHGFVPTEEELRAFPNPSGALNYNLHEDYQTLINPRSGAHWDDAPILREAGGNHREEFRGFEKARGEREIHESDQFERTSNRLALGRARVRQQLTDRETEQYFNDRIAAERASILKEKGLDKPGWTLKPEITEDVDREAARRAGWLHEGPVRTDLLSHGPTRVAPSSPGRVFTRLQKQAISINPFPHGLKNVGVLAFLHGGPEAFGRGLGYAQKGLDEVKTTRLIGMGLDADYVRNIGHPLEETLEAMGPLERGAAKAGTAFEAWTNQSNKVLTRLELGYRQALLDQLDRKWPRGEIGSIAERELELKKGHVIRQALGDYRNTSRFVSGLEAFGGPFVAFRVGIVPGAVARSLVRRPNYVEAVARGQETLNETAGGPSALEFGGPVEDAARLGSQLPFPLGYLTSPSSLGPLGIAARFADPNRTVSAGQIAGEAARDFIPGMGEMQSVGLLRDAFGGGYDPAPETTTAENAFASALGMYYKRRASGKAQTMFERRENRAP